ncbi:MAG: hypothetical protein WA738_08910 [Candidatus Angelobacter sp.]
MSLGRCSVLFCVLAVFPASSMAQKIDASFVVGGALATDAQETVPGICTPACVFPNNKFFTAGHVFFAANGAVRLANFGLASLYLEVPVEVAPSAAVNERNKLGSIFKGSQVTSLFVTPSIRLKLAPGAPVSPFASVGGGWARYKMNSRIVNSKPALEFGGGVDVKTALPLLAFRAEVRDFITEQPDFGSATLEPPGSQPVKSRRHNLLAGGGIVLRF